MDKGAKEYAKTLRINHCNPDNIPWRSLGQYKYRVLEDGSTTQYRICIIESLLPPRSAGPVFHFHEMHDEGFLVKSGRVRFHSPGKPHIDAKAGDLVTIPIRLPHKFSNPFDEEAVFVNTITPGFFVRYFEYLEELIGDGVVLTAEVNRVALMRFATVPLDNDEVTRLESFFGYSEGEHVRETDETYETNEPKDINGSEKIIGSEELNGTIKSNGVGVEG